MRQVGLGGRVALVGLCIVALTGCSVIDDFLDSGPERDPETGQLVEASEIDVFALQVGDCLTEFDRGDDVSAVQATPCDEPHTDEIYASVDMPDGPFPGRDRVQQFADEACSDEFADFIGIPWEESALDYRSFTPTEQSWKDGDREILCMVVDQGYEITGTLAGVQR
jgi:hypothetical protein